jgi:bifunctional DNA-binding transcriptional regulator/antitoxin component of YhaV-PrlF toxin-antitoxin module
VSATAIREKRETTIPEDVSNAAGLKPGDKIDWRFEDGEIRGRKLAHDLDEQLELEDLDPHTLLPKVGKIELKSALSALRNGRERHS